MVIGGRPGQGKSGLMGDLILATSKEVPVGVFSCEMPPEQFNPRLACNIACLNYHAVRRGKISLTEEDNYMAALDQVESLPIFVEYDNGLVGLDDYWLKARKIKPESMIDTILKKMVLEHGCKIIYVDYLQLINHIDKSIQDRRLEVGKIAEVLRDYAKSYNITLVLLSQLRRFDQGRMYGDEPPVPTMDDLKESGEIENHSDIVILLHRPQYYNKTKELTFGSVIEEDASLIIEKNRDGPTGAIAVDWYGHVMSYRDKEESSDIGVPF
jgi:replicative DNA helicase